MIPRPAANFIPEFDVPDLPDDTAAMESANPEETGGSEVFGAPLFESLLKNAPPKLEEAYAKGYEAGKAEGLAELEDRLEENRAYHARQLELERLTWTSREAEKLAEQIADGFGEIRARLSEATARILRPFLRELIQRQAISELVDELDMLLGADEGITLEISGPEDLLDRLREKLEGRNLSVLFAINDDVDLRIVIGQTILETCLGTWMRKVEERIE